MGYWDLFCYVFYFYEVADLVGHILHDYLESWDHLEEEYIHCLYILEI